MMFTLVYIQFWFLIELQLELNNNDDITTNKNNKSHMGTDEECEPNQSDSTAIEDSVTQIMSNLRQLQTLPRKIQK